MMSIVKRKVSLDYLSLSLSCSLGVSKIHKVKNERTNERTKTTPWAIVILPFSASFPHFDRSLTFHHHGIQLSIGDQPFDGEEQFIRDGTTGAPVLQFHHITSGLRGDQLRIDVDGRHIVDHHPDLVPLRIFQQMLERRGFPRAEESCQQGHGDG